MDNERLQAVYDEGAKRIAGRLKKDTDLFTGIKEVCSHFGVESAHFQCFGSLKYASYLQVERAGEGGLIQYSEKRQSNSAVELLSGSGFVGKGEDGEVDVHFHGMLIDCDGRLDGGHFIADENPVAVTIEFIIFPLDMDLQRGKDAHWGLPVFQFSQRSGK
ncbi:PCC domain-containing protein [Planomicrobium sp. YIM 101495]|uniref:PCC domain-containing protein n=1 Tax=Planomicrobium sp. YIM 101495 TaxID=2665160 RepID=UPI0012B73F72|nr:DUF296 domain-containing protein [Planomicrobium sp. YIM 101495]MTD31388.1 DUF296 domain-containing protein [Planomicrobium sp. YIM 101495]